jgi:hypothetical protein
LILLAIVVRKRNEIATHNHTLVYGFSRDCEHSLRMKRGSKHKQKKAAKLAAFVFTPAEMWGWLWN